MQITDRLRFDFENLDEIPVNKKKSETPKILMAVLSSLFQYEVANSDVLTKKSGKAPAG